MNTNINTNVDFGTNNSNTNTNSSIGSTQNNSSPTYTNTSQTNNNVQTESMDLSFATEQVANESKSILDSIGDFFSDLGEGLKETGATIANGAKTVANWAINGLKDLGSNIKEACTNLASNVTSILGSALSWAADTYIDLQSTATVIGTTVVSAVADIGETLVDGVAWTGGKLVEGGSWLVGKVAGWFSDDAEEAVMDWRAQAKTDVKEFIGHDWVGEANDWFYQETSLGKFINENSYFKYDSEAMQKLKSATEMVGKLAIATAATFIPGGAVIAPLLLGFASGTGEQAEKLYQENTNTTGAQELGIFVSGLGESLNWYAQGKLGRGALETISKLQKIGMKATGAQLKTSFTSGLENFIGKIQTEGLGKTAKDALSALGKFIKGSAQNSHLASLQATDNLIDSFGIIADNTSDWLVGNEEFNLKTAAKAGGELISAWFLNMFFDGAGEYLGKMGKQGDNILQDANIFSGDDTASLGSRFDEFTTGKTGSYGVDQAACRRMTYVERLNNDWLTDADDFRKFLKEKYPDWPDSEIEEALKIFTESERLSVVGKQDVIDYLQKNSTDYQSALEAFNNSFKAGKSPDYDRILNKYIQAGLSEADAIHLLSSIDTVGVCSYAAVANNIASTFMDNPQLFKETFGYDLFTVVDGKQVLNSSELLSDLYIYANMDTNGGKLFTMVDGKLTYLSKDFSLQTYLSGAMYTRDDLIDGFLKSKSPDLGYTDNIKVVSNYDRGILLGMTDSTKYTVEDVKKVFDEVLVDGNSVQLGIYRTPNNKFTFYNMDGSVHITTNSWNEGSGHAVFVTGMTDDGIIVSSWGEKLLIKYEDFINNRYNIAWGQITGVTPSTVSNGISPTGTTKVITEGAGDGNSYFFSFGEPQLTRGEQLLDDYLRQIRETGEMEVDFKTYLKQNGVEIREFKTKRQVAEFMGDSKLYIFDTIEQQITKGTATEELKKIYDQYMDMHVGDIDIEKMIDDFEVYLTQDEIKQARRLSQTGVDAKALGIDATSSYTEAEKYALFNYTYCGGYDINAFLNDGYLSSGTRAKDMYKTLDSIQNFIAQQPGNKPLVFDGVNHIDDILNSAIGRSSYDDAIVCYRGVSSIYGFRGEIIDLEDIGVGTEIFSRGFQSSSLLPEYNFALRDGNTDTNIILEIIIPPNSESAAYIENITGVQGYGQMEVLLKNGTSLKVVDQPYTIIANGVAKTVIPVAASQY